MTTAQLPSYYHKLLRKNEDVEMWYNTDSRYSRHKLNILWYKQWIR